MHRFLLFLSVLWLAAFPAAVNAQHHIPACRLPEVCNLPAAVNETSGLVFWRNSLWTHNDSGGLPVIYRIDTLSGKVLQRITVKNGQNHDWEDIAQDSAYLYVGDMGNNSGNRKNLCIYKIKKSDIPLSGDAGVSAEKIAFSYPDYRGPVKNRKSNNFDGEALLAAGDSLYLFSKDWKDQRSRLYALPKNSGKWVARLVSSCDVQGLVTGADRDPVTGRVALSGYTRGNWVPFVILLTGYTKHNFFSGDCKRIRLKAKATQIEGVAFGENKTLYFSSEGRPPVFRQTLYRTTVDTLEKAASRPVKKRRKHASPK